MKKAVALILGMAVILSLFSLGGCRSAGEVAMTFGDVKAENDPAKGRFDVSAALYMMFLMMSDSEFKNTVKSNLEEQQSTSLPANYAFEKQKLEEKDYASWVRNKAQERAAEYAYVELEFARLKLTLSDDAVADRDSAVAYYWLGDESQQQAGYQELYEANGVSKSTFTAYYTNQYKREELFKAAYFAGGSAEISKADYKKGLDDNYVLVNVAQLNFKDAEDKDITDEDKKTGKEKLEGYAARLNKGEKFAVIKQEYEPEEAAAEEEETDDTSPKPLDKSARIYGGEKTQNPSEYFTELHKLKLGEAKVLEFTDCYLLALRLDVLADPYYVDHESMNSEIRHILKDDEFNKNLTKKSAEVAIDKNQGVLGYYAPKKLKDVS